MDHALVDAGVCGLDTSFPFFLANAVAERLQIGKLQVCMKTGFLRVHELERANKTIKKQFRLEQVWLWARILLDFYGFCWISMDFAGFRWILMDFDGISTLVDG